MDATAGKLGGHNSAAGADPIRRPMPTFADTNLNKIDRLAHGLYPSLAMLAGMQLDLFSPLAEGSRTAAELAALLHVREDRLRPLLDALVIAELLIPDGDDRYANAPEAHAFLVKGKEGYRGGAHELYAEVWSAALQTAESLRAGRPQAPIDFDAMDDDALALFFRGLQTGSLMNGRNLLASGLDLSGHKSLLDVGGGSGGMTIALCEALPELRATILELPRVAPIARRRIAEVGLADRVDVVAGNAADAPPDGQFDLVTLCSVIQVLGRETAASLLKNVGRAVTPGGRIVITGRVLDDDRRSPAHVALFNLVFLNVYEAGLAYTEAEYRDWLSGAGFVDIERSMLKANGLLTARRAG